MRRNFWANLPLLIAGFCCIAPPPQLQQGDQGPTGQPAPTFSERLQSPVAVFDAAGRPFVRIILDLAYEYQLPLGLEYVDGEAMERPLNVKLKNKRVRDILQVVVAQLPQYRLVVTPLMLEIYSPKARTDSSNLLNTPIDNFKCLDQSPRMASVAVYSAMMAQIHVPCCQVGDVPDFITPRAVSLDLQKKKVYELLNTIIRQNGQSVWAVVARPEKLSAPGAKLWEVYGLGPGSENLLLHDLANAFKEGNRSSAPKARAVTVEKSQKTC